MSFRHRRRHAGCRAEVAYLDRLRTVEPFRDASPGELRAVAQVADFLSVPAGAALAGPRVAWRGVYVVASGSAALTSGRCAALVDAGGVVRLTDDTALVAVTAMTVVAVPAREWRALQALAPGITAALDAGLVALRGAPARVTGEPGYAHQ